MLHITTPYGDHFAIDEQGNFIQYNQHKFTDMFTHEWKFIGLMPTNCSSFFRMIPFNQITREWIKLNTPWLSWKNGNPRYTVVDRDHGTLRIVGNTKVHGVRCIYFDERV